MQLKDIFSASSNGVSQPSNNSLRFKQKALAATILATLAIIAFIAVEASDTKPARKAPTEAAMITLRPDGTDKDVLIARYDANFLALSRRIEEVQREAAATETRLRAIIADQKSRLETQTSEVKDLKAIAGRAGLMPRPGETPEETEARIKSLLKANDDAAYISKLSSQFGSKTPGKVFHTDPARNTNEPASSIVPALPDISGDVKVPDEAHAAARQAVSGLRLAMVTLPPPAPPTSPAPRVGPSPTLNPDTPLQVNRAAGTTVEDYLPAGSFVRGRLLTGVYASTGAGAASQPLPMVIRLEGTAVLPTKNPARLQFCAGKDCCSETKVRNRLYVISLLGVHIMARKRPLSILDTSIAYETVGLDMALAAFNSDHKKPNLIDRIAYDKRYEFAAESTQVRRRIIATYFLQL